MEPMDGTKGSNSSVKPPVPPSPAPAISLTLAESIDSSWEEINEPRTSLASSSPTDPSRSRSTRSMPADPSNMALITIRRSRGVIAPSPLMSRPSSAALASVSSPSATSSGSPARSTGVSTRADKSTASSVADASRSAASNWRDLSCSTMRCRGRRRAYFDFAFKPFSESLTFFQEESLTACTPSAL